MSSGAVGDCGKERTLTRSVRTRKGTVLPVVVENSSGSKTDSIGTETETVAGWVCSVKEESEIETDIVVGWSGLERKEREWSTQAQSGFDTSSENKMSRRDHESKDSGRGHTPAPSVNEMMQMFLEVGRRRDEEKREREDECRSNREQQALLVQSLMERWVAPEPAPVCTTFDLPRMKEEEEIEKFIPIFETSLQINEVPQNLWKQKLLTHLPLEGSPC